MTTATMTAEHGAAKRVRVQVAGARRVIRRLESERRTWMRRAPGAELVATELAWRAGVAEGLRLAQATLRKGV